jgi:hypothetical protein
MRTNGAFDGMGPVDRLRAWWYGMDRASRVNKLLFLAAGISLVAFVNAANRGPGGATGVSAGNLPRPTLSGPAPSSTALQPAAIPAAEAPVPPAGPSTTSTTTQRPPTVRATSTTAPARATPSPAPAPAPAPAGDPGVIFSPAPTTTAPPATTAPPTSSTTSAPTTTSAPATTTTVAPTTTAPSAARASAPTTPADNRSVLQVLLGN